MGKSSTWKGTTAYSSEVDGPGSRPGAGETPSTGPGKAAMRTRMNGTENPGGYTSGSTPKGMKIEREGE